MVSAFPPVPKISERNQLSEENERLSGNRRLSLQVVNLFQPPLVVNKLKLYIVVVRDMLSVKLGCRKSGRQKFLSSDLEVLAWKSVN